jgi:hypothetical protein
MRDVSEHRALVQFYLAIGAIQETTFMPRRGALVLRIVENKFFRFWRTPPRAPGHWH